MKIKHISSNPAIWTLLLINIIIFAALNIFPDLASQFLLNPNISIVMERPWSLWTVVLAAGIIAGLIFRLCTSKKVRNRKGK